jgi:lipoprotein NlpI
LGDTKNDVTEPEIEITPELYESHNYLVLYFDNEFDWQSAVDAFEVKQQHAIDSKDNYKRIGTGRVINGGDVLKKIL